MKTPAIVKENPVVVSQVVALLAVLLVEALGWITLGLGEWAPIAGAVLAAAGVGRSQVTPVSKL
jgi:hypothetical protein